MRNVTLVSDVDVAVVGAGPAGSALATMLGRAGVSTALFDASRFPRDKACGEGLMPAGVDVLARLGIGLDAFPRLTGVTYRMVGDGAADGAFAAGASGRAVRRTVFDAMLAAHAAATPNVDARFGSAVEAIAAGRLKTADGELQARFVVGADGLRSRVARWMGWSRGSRGRARYAVVGHAHSPAHGLHRVVVTLLDGCEVYAAPTGADELLLAVLGGKGRVTREAYASAIRVAHPDVIFGGGGRLHGAGPFWVRPAKVATRGVFLLGDAAGFLDPLTGDGMTDALVAAETLARLLTDGAPEPERAYARWEARQWRRRVFVNRLALALTGSSTLARRALRKLRRRPATLDRLLAINDGSGSLWSLSPRDWSALAGI